MAELPGESGMENDVSPVRSELRRLERREDDFLIASPFFTARSSSFMLEVKTI